VAITNGYATLAEVKAVLRLTDSTDDTLLENTIEGASRRIDGYCGTFFYQTAKVVNLYPINEYKISFPDAGTVTYIKTDNDGDGVFETTWTVNTDYQLEPLDYALQNRPYRHATAVGAKTFPIMQLRKAPGVQISATWGWPSIPDDVREACILLSIRGFARYNAALGVIGFNDMAIQVRAIDPDVRDLLSPYRKLGVA